MGRGLVIWFLCLSALLVGFLGAQVNPLAYLLVGRPDTLAGAGGGLALRGVGGPGVGPGRRRRSSSACTPSLDTFWQNLGFLNLLLMGVVLASLQCRGVGAPQAIIVTVVALTVVARC